MSLRLAALVACATLLPAPAMAQSGFEPIRSDNWLFFQRNTNNTNQWKLDPRLYVPYRFENGWTFTQRVDLPMIDTNDTGPGKPWPGYSFGLSDVYIEEIFRTPALAKNLWLDASLRIVFATGRQSPYGDSQYQLAPNLGFTWDLPDAWRGVTIDPHVRYFWGFDPQYDNVSTKRALDVYPAAEFGLGQRWTLALYPENPITYNYRKGQWFAPIDLMLLHRIDPRFQYGFGGAYKLGNPNDPSYRYIIDARLTFTF